MKVRLLILFFLTIGWLVPFVLVGSTLARLPFRLPARIWQQYNAAALFTKRVATWSDWSIEIRMVENGQWQTIDIRDVSPMPTSGYRQRMDRILSDTRRKKIGGSLRCRLASWIAQNVSKQTGQELTGVRFLHRTWRTNTPEMEAPPGAWDGDGAVLTMTTRVTVTGSYDIVNRIARPEPVQKRAPATIPTPRVFRRSNPPQLSSE